MANHHLNMWIPLRRASEVTADKSHSDAGAQVPLSASDGYQPLLNRGREPLGKPLLVFPNCNGFKWQEEVRTNFPQLLSSLETLYHSIHDLGS